MPTDASLGLNEKKENFIKLLEIVTKRRISKAAVAWEGLRNLVSKPSIECFNILELIYR
jgi:predicted site-specific integrase-resolvase